MSEFDFTEGGIARQHKLLDSRKEYDPRVAKFLAALDEIEKLRAECARLLETIKRSAGELSIARENGHVRNCDDIIRNLFEALKGGEE